MSAAVDFVNVTTEGLESSPVAQSLAGLRANEARYLHNKYGHALTPRPADQVPEVLAWVQGVLDERELRFAARPLQAEMFQADGIAFAYVFYEDGLALNVMYTLEDAGKRAVGFKLCEDMEVPAELAEKFKFARQRSRLAGTIRGSYFTIKAEHPLP